MMQVGQSGFRAFARVAAMQDQPVMGIPAEILQVQLTSFFSTAGGYYRRLRSVRLATRKYAYQQQWWF
jgi:hypothetical protein